VVFFSFFAQRATGATKMNEVSSRSHAVCIIIVEKCTTNEDLMAAAAAAGVGGWAKQAALAAQANGGQQSIKVSR
jgi:kinesin family protein 3/17